MRKIWPKGTVLYTRDGAAYTIGSANDTGGSAVIYFASSSRSGVRAVLKEFYPSEGWVRKGGVPVPEKCADAAWDDPLLQSGVQQLSGFAKQEMDISQEIARRTALVWPFREMLQVTKICEPGNGSVWTPGDKAGDILPCCILLMDDLNHPDGLWLKDLLREAAFEKSAAHPLGNLQGRDEPELAVPPVAAAVDAARCILSLLYRIHHGGYLHGDINLGNVFLLVDHTGGKITSAMTIDFGSARCLVDGKTAPVQKDTLFTTPGFCAPEIEKGKLSDKPLQLTEKADVYSVGKLLRMLLYPEAAAAFREHRSLELWLRGAALSEWDVYDSAVSPDILRRLNEILTGAAKEEVGARSSVEEMLEQLNQVHRLLEPPPWQVKLALPELNGSEVIGRETDICSIEKELQAHRKLVLWGFSGIGKTKLVTLLGHERQKIYPDTQVYYAFFPGSMTSLVLNTLAQNISTVDTTMETKDKKQVPRPGEAIAADVFAELNAHMHPDDLLIIDNIDSDTKSWEELVHERSPWGKDLFEELCSLQCRVIFVTRMDLKNAEGIAPYPVEKLDGENLRALLRRYSDDAKVRSDQELDDLIQLVDYHTMTVAMVSKTMQESELTVPEIYKELEQGEYGSDAFVRIKGEKPGDYEQRKIEGHLICLFRLSNFNEREQALLRYAQLIGEDCGMYKKLFLICCPHKNREENTANLEALNHLVHLGYIQQKKEENSEEAILNLHTLVRVVAKRALPIEENQADAFLEGMPIPYHISCREYSDKFPHQSRVFIAEAYTQARAIATREDFLFGYWSSCASFWFNNAQSYRKSNYSLRAIEYLPDGMCTYNALKNGLLSLTNVLNASQKVLRLYWGLWDVLCYITPGIVRMNGGTSELARNYWTFCLNEPDRKLAYPALFYEYQKCYNLCEEIRKRFLADFQPNNYWDYRAYTNIASHKDRIRAGQNLLKRFKRRTSEDYKCYLEICAYLTDDIHWHSCMSDSDSASAVLPSLEQQEKLAAYEYMEFLLQQNPIDYEQVIQLCEKQIKRFEILEDEKERSRYQKELLEIRKNYLDFLSKQEPQDVVRKVICCDRIAEQYMNDFPGKKRSEHYRKIASSIRLDFWEHPEKYSPVQNPLDEMRIYDKIICDRIVNSTIQLPTEKICIQRICNKILSIGQANEEKALKDLNREDHHYGKQPMLNRHEKVEFYNILQKAASQLERFELTQKYAKIAQEILHGKNISSWWLRNEPQPKPNPMKSFSRIAHETNALLYDLKGGELTDEKDRHYRQVIFEKAKMDNSGSYNVDSMMQSKYQNDLLKILNAYKEVGDYRRQLIWLEQIISLQAAGLWKPERYFFDFMVPLMWWESIDGKLDIRFYSSHYFMEPYYEKAICAAQHIHNYERAFELVEELFDIISQDNLAIYPDKSFLKTSDLVAWLRTSSLYAYCCCMQKRYTRAGNILLMANDDLKNFYDNLEEHPYMLDVKVARIEFSKQRSSMFLFFQEQLILLEKILPAHHPILYMQRDLQIWFCENEEQAKTLETLNEKEKLIAIENGWDSWWELSS